MGERAISQVRLYFITVWLCTVKRSIMFNISTSLSRFMVYRLCYKLLIMITKTYIGTIKEESYGFRTNRGYEPSLSLECENGESIQLGNSNYYSEFSSKVGQRIKLTIEELEPLEEDED